MGSCKSLRLVVVVMVVVGLQPWSDESGGLAAKAKLTSVWRREVQEKEQEDVSSCMKGGGEGDAIISDWESALGDPGMQDPNRVRVGLESWNFCNKVGSEGPGMPSPRQADCADLPFSPHSPSSFTGVSQIQHLVSHDDNALKSGEAFPQGSFTDYVDPDHYAVEKELYLASLCEVKSSKTQGPWHFWMIMLKNGNFDVNSDLCPSTALVPKLTRPFKQALKAGGRFPCFGQGCMNHPIIYHNWSSIQAPSCSDGGQDCTNNQSGMVSGSFYGTYDLDGTKDGVIGPDMSYFSVKWEKNSSTGSWQFHHVLKTNNNYPWLMLYLRADATKGLSGGYPWETRGMMVKVPESPNFKVKVALEVVRGGGPQSQFYMLDIGGCWKNDGTQCDGNTTTDVTRYSEMIINPSTPNWCRPADVSLCPPYHVDAATGEHVHRTNTTHFPYAAYHLYCVPSNARFAEVPFRVCDPYSNPQPQELMQLLPHPEWAVHGFPSAKGQGWEGLPTSWLLDVGALSHRLFFYQDPKTPPAVRKWPSIDVGTEIYVSENEAIAEWIVSDFDVLIPKSVSSR